MAERPILFAGRLVRAILAGQKTQTRRLVTKRGFKPAQGCSFERDWKDVGVVLEASPGRLWSPRLETYKGVAIGDLRCPYGVPGDRLWVRETWRSWAESCEEDHPHGFDVPCGPYCHQVYVAYAATPRDGYRPTPDKARITYLDASTPLENNQELLGPWRPSIHMPRWASRITLEVTEVRLQRLQEISDEDIAAEGTVVPTNSGNTLRDWFACHWDEIHAERAPWSSSPWVWALTFRRVQ